MEMAMYKMAASVASMACRSACFLFIVRQRGPSGKWFADFHRFAATFPKQKAPLWGVWGPKQRAKAAAQPLPSGNFSILNTLMVSTSGQQNTAVPSGWPGMLPP